MIPKSGEQEDQTAPREVAASMAMMVSDMLGMNPTTRSPDLTPRVLRDLAKAATVEYNWA